MPTTIQEDFIQLIRFGIRDSKEGRISEQIDWLQLKALADAQGLSAVVLDGIEKLPEGCRPQQEFLLNWIGEVLQSYEQRYVLYKRTIVEMAKFYNEHGYKMMIIKGFACSTDWPKPEHRPCGDIDIWQFGKQKEADAFLTQEKGINVDSSHHHHTVFEWNGFTVENHYDFINVYHHKSNRGLEAIFKELGRDNSHFVELNGEKVYLPSPNLHALFMLKHAMNDFTSFSMTLRQLLDWAFFVEKHNSEIEWNWLTEVLEKYHMMDFFNTINAICVEDLGFEASIFHGVQFNPALKEKVLNDILEPEFTVAEPSCLIPRLIYKYKRWKGNSWKHELCYQESMWTTFWYGVWGHLLKPKTI